MLGLKDLLSCAPYTVKYLHKRSYATAASESTTDVWSSPAAEQSTLDDEGGRDSTPPRAAALQSILEEVPSSTGQRSLGEDELQDRRVSGGRTEDLLHLQ